MSAWALPSLGPFVLQGCGGSSSTEVEVINKALAHQGHGLITAGVDFCMQLPLLLMVN